MVDHRGTVTPDEHAVLTFLADGPALLAPRTAVTTYSAAPSKLWATPTPGDRLRGPRETRTVRTVEAKVARRLAGCGWVIIDAGGTVTLREHRLAKPTGGGPGDGHLCVCSCGEPFDAWADGEAHQAAAEGAP